MFTEDVKQTISTLAVMLLMFVAGFFISYTTSRPIPKPMQTIYDTIQYLDKGITELKQCKAPDFETRVSIRVLEKAVQELRTTDVRH